MAGGATVSIVIKAIDDYSNNLDKAQQKLISFKQIAITAGLAAATGLAAFTKSSIEAAAKMKPIEESFKKLAENSEQFLAQLQETTDGTINNFDLMSNANKALLLGLEQNKLPEFFKNAIILGKAAGRTANEAIQDITLGIGRQSKLILDNLGIIVSAEQAYKTYATQIGKTTEQLTDQEKQIAFTTAALTSLNEKSQQLGGKISDDINTKWEKIGAQFSNLQTEIGSELLPKVEEFLTLIIDNKDTVIELANALATVVKAIASLIIGTVKVTQTLGNVAGAVGSFTEMQLNGASATDAWTATGMVWDDQMNKIWGTTEGVTTAIDANTNATGVNNNVKQVGNIITAQGVPVTQAQTSALDGSTQSFKEEKTAIDANTAALKANIEARSAIVRDAINDLSRRGKLPSQGGVSVYAQGSGGGAAFAQQGQKVGVNEKGQVVVDTGGLFKTPTAGLTGQAGKGQLGGYYKSVSDALITKGGDVVEFDPADDIMASKNGFGGPIINVIVQGSISTMNDIVDTIESVLMDRLRNKITIGLR